MARHRNILSGLALGPALLCWVAACAPVAPPPPKIGTMASAMAALQPGDLAALRAGLGHDDGLVVFAAAQADALDPRAWLIVMGASWRQNDPAACAAALQARNRAALLRGLGFDDQALESEVLSAGRTVFARRAGGLDYYESGKSALSVLRPDLAPDLAPGVAAYEIAYWTRVETRVVRVRVGRNQRGLSNLQAVPDPGSEGAPAAPAGARHASVSLAAGDGACGLQLPYLGQDSWWAMDLRVVMADGTLATTRLARDGGGWFVLEASRATLAQRLEAERDRRLELARRSSADLLRSAGRWPAARSDLSLRPVDWADPASPAGRRGWSDHDQNVAPGLELLRPAGDDDPAVQCTHAGPQGRRAITRAGALIWRQP